jgi:hypothetical protein
MVMQQVNSDLNKMRPLCISFAISENARLCFAVATRSKRYISLDLLVKSILLYRLVLAAHDTKHPNGFFLRATDASKQAHATEPPGLGQTTPSDAARRRRLVPDTLVTGETALVGRRARGEPAALAPRMVVGAAGEALVSPSPRWRSAGGGEALVVHSPSRRPPLADRAANERDEPLHAHVATICAADLSSSSDRDGDFPGVAERTWHEIIMYMGRFDISATALTGNQQIQIMHDVNKWFAGEHATEASLRFYFIILG